ncbi:aldose epimerase family protein [Leisingera sp. ANG59]|uniref:aldose epimerase family protein n=1 Tax=Leisingera sp. ANG59 TaxID=2675221 RepID=UPI001571DDFE|nr:aldose epimerase family protein [Leisingera sp. ANG59]NSY40178.1 galactose mutarotase [Leisingera sp. ANG59]
MLDDTDLIGIASDETEVHALWIGGGPVMARVMTWGASLVDLRLAGVEHSLVLGSVDYTAYLGPMQYFGAIVGPVANRIAGGRMTVDGRDYQLDRNEAGQTTLHGGAAQFSGRNWTLEAADASSVTLGLHHTHGTGGFPGEIDVKARYSLDSQGALAIEIEGSTDRPAMFGPAFHGYWTLDGGADVSGHRLTVDAEHYLPVTDAMIPSNGPAPVAGTAFDYRSPRAPDPGLDHNFCLARTHGQMRRAATIAAGGLRLTVDTTEVGLQVYAGGSLASAPAKELNGRPYGLNAGIAFEPQFWPDSPNHPDFPSPVLRAGDRYRQVSRFAVTRT